MRDRGDAKLFEELHEAIARPKRVKISYNGIGGATERVVEPLKLVFKSSAWYLGDFCLVRSDFRFFKQKINNMTWDGMIGEVKYDYQI